MLIAAAAAIGAARESATDVLGPTKVVAQALKPGDAKPGAKPAKQQASKTAKPENDAGSSPRKADVRSASDAPKRAKLPGKKGNPSAKEDMASTKTAARRGAVSDKSPPSVAGVTKTDSRPRVSAQSATAPKSGSSPARVAAKPWDPYRLSAFFATAFDLTRYAITPQAAARYRAASCEGALRFASDVRSRREDMNDERRQNLKRAVRALYLVGLARRADGGLGSPLTVPHEIALRSTVRDAVRRRAGDSAREAMLEKCADRLAERLASVGSASDSETPAIDGVEPAGLAGRGVTVSVIDQVATANDALVAERAIPAEVAAAMGEVWRDEREWRRRLRFADLAPRLPTPSQMVATTPIVPLDTPLPDENSSSARKTARQDARPSAPGPRGVTLRGPLGAPVRAAKAGKAVFAGKLQGLGIVVVVEHEDQWFTVYGHLAAALVTPNEEVTRGQPIGRTGPLPLEDGCGAYYEVRRREKVVPASELAGALGDGEIVAH